jgi:hypothetical protein
MYLGNVLRPPQDPEHDYPAGWWTQFVKYLDSLPNVMGVACFVDQDLGNNWGNTAMTSGVGRCPEWDHERSQMLQNGW